MKIYLVESGTGDNYIMAETAKGILCNNCAPDGCWAGIEIGTLDDNEQKKDLDKLARQLYQATDPNLTEEDLDWMGDPCYSSMDEWEAEQEDLPDWQKDTLYYIGEFPYINGLDYKAMGWTPDGDGEAFPSHRSDRVDPDNWLAVYATHDDGRKGILWFYWEHPEDEDGGNWVSNWKLCHDIQILPHSKWVVLSF